MEQQQEQHKRKELERIKETTAGSISSTGKIGGKFERKQNPAFLAKRDEIFAKSVQRMKDMYEKVEKTPIKITLKDGKQLDGLAFQTSPQDIAKQISQKLIDNVFVAKVTYSKKYDLGFGEVTAADEDENAEEQDEQENQDSDKKFEIIDLHRPLEGDCLLELLDFEDNNGKSTFFHSSAHLLGNVIEQHFGSHLCIGPPLKQGFYYDAYMGDEKVQVQDIEKLEKIASDIMSKKLPFERVLLTKQEALELFQHNPFKVQLIQNKVPEAGFTSAYKVGSLIDLCTGPHLPHSGRIKAFKITKNSAAYWLGNNKNDDLQRVYGVAFPKAAMLKDYIKIQEELAKRDHRNIGQTYDLFSFNHMAPGCAFFYPKGAHIYNSLMEMLKKQYKIRGYTEVMTPNLYDAQLWKISGHWTKYQENMFLVKGDDDKDQHGFKPMNCPGHCLMFDMKHVSYRDLPMRYADFGVLHRNELSGALSGLTRVRRFVQDDAHIFCRQDQVAEEIFGCLDFISYVYNLFGFKFTLGLSTRPKNFLGEPEQWDHAEEDLRQALIKFGKPFKINKEDGAFYGPKIDIELFDAFGRGFQCGTIQLDFQQPIRFNLQYKAAETKEQVKFDKEHPVAEKVPLLKKEEEQLQKEIDNPALFKSEAIKGGDVLHNAVMERKESQDTSVSTRHHKEKKFQLESHHVKAGYQRPVIIHRAVLGSFERFIAILCENTAGKWPFWLSPKQIIILPITKYQFDYADKLKERFIYEGYNAVVDKSCQKIDKMVRNAQSQQYNYMLCVGKKEEADGTIDIRDRDAKRKEVHHEQQQLKEKEDESKKGDNKQQQKKGGKKPQQKGADEPQDGESIGVFTVAQALELFKSRAPPACDLELAMKAKAYFNPNDEELRAYNESLQFQVYLEGEGFELGAKDKEVYEKFKEIPVDKSIYPNVFRWLQFVKKQLN